MTVKELYIKVEEKRKKMYEIAAAKGLTNIETINCSVELDVLLNQLILQTKQELYICS
ncbi:aspartyl-phosphate phosphatase Spo0E family protein [Oceanobacillus damuensis]|uniref:aspartyl-phosphate phosphatase Spo0E family protein n=1 Tax=Oceanobacillus damuensis TaxID=937928 RepID=UPI000A02A274|nr:aspartyl-phosphate phosphatase Spo0E family protein [Oceanobacillus damuensis]